MGGGGGLSPRPTQQKAIAPDSGATSGLPLSRGLQSSHRMASGRSVAVAVSSEIGLCCVVELSFFAFGFRIFHFILEGFRGSIPLWCRAGWGWRWDQRLPGLASPHIKPDSIFWQSTQLHSWVTFTTPEKPRPTSSLGITVRGGLLDAACGGWLAGSGRACGREPPRRVEGRIQGGGEAPPHLRKGGAKPLPNLSRAVSWLAVPSGTAAN